MKDSGRYRSVVLMGYSYSFYGIGLSSEGDWRVSGSFSGGLCFRPRFGTFLDFLLVGGDWTMTFIFPYTGNDYPN